MSPDFPKSLHRSSFLDRKTPECSSFVAGAVMSRKFPGPAGVACASAQLRSAKFGVQRCHLRSALAGMGGVPGRAAGAPKKILRLNNRFKQVSIKVFEHFQRGCKGTRFFSGFPRKNAARCRFFSVKSRNSPQSVWCKGTHRGIEHLNTFEQI